MTRCSFKPKTHQYYFHRDGQTWEVPSVTQIIRDGGGAPDYSQVRPDVLEMARERGERVHNAIKSLYSGPFICDAACDISGYLKGFLGFTAAVNFHPILVEKKVFHESFGYAGTLDLYGTANGRYSVIDVKLYKPGSYVGEQTAAYACALESMGKKVELIFGLQLKGNAKYQLVSFDRRYEYERAFMRRLRTVLLMPKWKERK